MVKALAALNLCRLKRCDTSGSVGAHDDVVLCHHHEDVAALLVREDVERLRPNRRDHPLGDGGRLDHPRHRVLRVSKLRLDRSGVLQVRVEQLALVAQELGLLAVGGVGLKELDLQVDPLRGVAIALQLAEQGGALLVGGLDVGAEVSDVLRQLGRNPERTWKSLPEAV